MFSSSPDGLILLSVCLYEFWSNGYEKSVMNAASEEDIQLVTYTNEVLSGLKYQSWFLLVQKYSRLHQFFVW